MQRERPAVQRAAETHRAAHRVRERAVLVAAVRSLDDRVDLLQRVTEFMIRVRGREFQFQDETVDLVDEDANRQSLLRRVFDQPLGVAHHPFHRVDDEKDAVRESVRRGNLVAEVDVPGGVHQVEEKVLPRPRRQRQGHRHGFDADLPVLLVQTRVRVPQLLLVRQPLVRDLVRLLREHVHERRLPVVQMPRDRDVSNQVRVPREPFQKLLRHVHHRRVPLSHLHRLLLHRRDDRLLERLRVLVHDERLRPGAVDFLRARVVLFVLRENDRRLRVRVVLLVHQTAAAGVRGFALDVAARFRVHPRVVLLVIGRLVVALQLRADVVPELVVHLVGHGARAFSPTRRSRSFSSSRPRVDPARRSSLT
mmetsp:Transcript_622/g.2017  ORF Transcript_622/g.2017 Transcript_622/m.2017 type:complete len:365 (-) Transcript_622:95-1189(-)